MRINQIGGAFRVRLLGTALVVISDSTESLDKRRGGLSFHHCRTIEVDYQSGSKQPQSKGCRHYFFQCKYPPPSHRIICPVISSASSLARNAISAARCSGLPRFLMAWFCMTRLNASSLEWDIVPSVAIIPGATALTVMLSSPSSLASTRV